VDTSFLTAVVHYLLNTAASWLGSGPAAAAGGLRPGRIRRRVDGSLIQWTVTEKSTLDYFDVV